MNAEQREALRNSIQDAMLTKLLEGLESGKLAGPALKSHYDLKLQEQELELAARRADLAEKKASGENNAKPFSQDEYHEGLTVMMQKDPQP
jgi:hypothetical protein